MDGDYEAGRSANGDTLARGVQTRSEAFLDGALANPGVEPHHLLAILRNPAVTPALVQRIARSPVWMKDRGLRAAIVLHARTPRQLAMGLLTGLHWGDLLRVSTAPQVATTVRTSAATILVLRLPDLETGEKVTLARGAPASLVPHLVRETEVQVARALLENPRTRAEDALQMIAPAEVPPAILTAVAECPRFAVRDDVRHAIAAHLRTPTAVALRIVGTMDAEALGRLLAEVSLPPLIAMAATRRLEETARDPRTIL